MGCAGDVPDVVEYRMLSALEQQLAGAVVEQQRDRQVAMAVPDMRDVSSDVLAGKASLIITRHQHLLGRPMILRLSHCELHCLSFTCVDARTAFVGSDCG